MMEKLKHLLAIILLISAVSVRLNAQPEEFPQDEIPVDGGIGLLVAAGALFGIKKLKEKK